MNPLEPPPNESTPVEHPQFREWIYQLWERVTKPKATVGVANDDGLMLAAFRSPRRTSTATSGGIYYNFLNYGGVADGVTNNSPALTTLIATVTAAGGGVIYFPEGAYAFNSTITTADDCKIRFLGDGISSRLVTLSTITTFFNAGSNTTFDNLNIDTGAFGNVAIRIDSGSSVGTQWARYILNCYFNSTAAGQLCIQFGNTQTFTGYGTVIDNCLFNLGSASIIFQRVGADTLSNRRIFTNCKANSTAYADLGGMNGWVIVGCDMLVPLTTVGTIPENCVITGNNLSLGSGWTVRVSNTVIEGNNLAAASVITVSSSCTDLSFGPNSVETGATIVVNCFSASNNSIFFPRRSYAVAVQNPGGFTLGNGSLQGFVQWLGQHVSVQIALQWGTTTVATIPAAGFLFSLPTVNGVSSPFGSVFPVGTGMAFNGNAYGLYAYCNPATTSILVGNMNNNNVTTPLDPIVPVNTDRYYFNLHYAWL